MENIYVVCESVLVLIIWYRDFSMCFESREENILKRWFRWDIRFYWDIFEKFLDYVDWREFEFFLCYEELF